ncbi:hypothetical protein J2125_003944 [Erwinia toletana]|uniref:Uncharacterized protein n=1 Tax=Winslowiella toletana TaxID=92490 RepID=A0ABS4PEZ5_9GAMM|nr:hypothetical protein [Winslowiella toletana]MBP2170752.1 hypothetical protein [Winslowiella toletana]
MMKSLDELLSNNGNKQVYEINGQQVVVDLYRKASQSDIIGYELYGLMGLGMLCGQSIITPDGDAYDDFDADELRVLGVVTAIITPVYEAARPAI